MNLDGIYCRSHHFEVTLHADSPTGADTQGAERAFDILWRTVHSVNCVSREVGRRHGITDAQLLILAQLRRTPSLSVNDLADRTMTHQSTMSKVVRGLVQRRLVMKATAEDDARRVALTLTPAGARLVRQIRGALRVLLAGAISQLAAAERDAIERGLGQFLRALETRGASPTTQGAM